MSLSFFILALLTLAGALGAMTLRRLVHCALCLTLTFVGLAGLYLQLNAQFVGLVQILVYVGAVAILLVFAILLTRNSDTKEPRVTGLGILGPVVALLVLGCLMVTLLGSPVSRQTGAEEASFTVKAIGKDMMNTYVLPLEVMGLLLTAALIGAVIIAMQEPSSRRTAPSESESKPVEEPDKDSSTPEESA